MNDDSASFGGQQLMGVRAARALLIKGHRVTFIFYGGNKRLQQVLSELAKSNEQLLLINSHSRSKTLQLLRMPMDFRDLLFLREKIIQLQPDIVLAVQGDIEIGSKILIAAALCKKKLISYIPYAHTSKHKGSFLGFLRDILSRILYPMPDGFITSSQASAKALLKLGAKKSIVVRDYIEPNDVHLSKILLKKKHRIEENKFVAALPARIQFRHKGQDFLIDALRHESLQSLENTLFVIVGDGPDEKKLRSLVIKERLESVFLFLPWQRTVTEILQMSDLLLMPSVFEGTPLTMLEAMSIGCPVLASRVDGMMEVLPNEMTYTKGNAKEFLEKLRRFAKNELPNVQELLARNKEICNQDFSQERYEKDFEPALLMLCNAT